WDARGTPVGRAIVWQDRRTAEHCAELKEQGHEKIVRDRTGLLLDPYFSGTKLVWMLGQPGIRDRATQGELRFGTMDSWLVWKLTSGAEHVTDVTNASRTLMFDIHRRAWDDTLLGLLGDIPRSLLPRVTSSAEKVGVTRGLDILPDGIPIAGIAGDQHAALFGQACFEVGMAKCTYGTGAFALVNTGLDAVASSRGLVTTIAWQVGDQVTYALEGSVFIAGAAVQWLRDGLRIIDRSEDIAELAARVQNSGGVTVVPAFTGLGAPHWNPEARGLIAGITRGTTRAHIARATLEGIALQVADLLDAMRGDANRPISVLRVDGGAAANDLLMQFQSDLLQVELHRPTVLDTTALGAAYLAAIGSGIFAGSSEISDAWAIDRVFEPAPPSDSLKQTISNWRRVVVHA
ncbi:MAG: glycerol kinase GlpK, partial [Clostridia bacterium]|nr:glycerol kinase GlpK [Deltaproteobacteria bacterium]